MLTCSPVKEAGGSNISGTQRNWYSALSRKTYRSSPSSSRQYNSSRLSLVIPTPMRNTPSCFVGGRLPLNKL